jgi:hypothetical protein
MSKIPGSIPAPNSGSIMEKNKKNIGSQMGKTNKRKNKRKKNDHLNACISYVIFSMTIVFSASNTLNDQLV